MNDTKPENRLSSSSLQQPQLTADQFVEKLRRALRRDGDFPASAKVVAELRDLVSKPKTTANQITEVILREPSLGTRVLHLVNSSFYRRAKPIMTVSQAVVQIGMRPLAELCAGLVLLQKFIPAARQGGAFANCLKQTLTTSLVTSSICTAEAQKLKEKQDETGYLAGTFLELGSLLLAYYFPKLYEASLQRSQQKNQPLARSIKEITGLTPVELSLEVIDELKLPQFYKETIKASYDTSSVKELANKTDSTSLISRALHAGHQISSCICSEPSKEELEKIVANCSQATGLDVAELGKVLNNLPAKFQDHCSSLDLHLPSMPTHLRSLGNSDSPKSQETEIFTLDAEFDSFVDEIRQAVERQESTASIITSVMETFAWSLGFDRVLLMLVGSSKTSLSGRMLLGNVPGFDPKGFERPVENSKQPYAVDAQALREGRPIFTGDPVLDNGWPCVGVPIGFGKKAIGVLYADRCRDDAKELSGQEQAAVGVLAELLDQSISRNG